MHVWLQRTAPSQNCLTRQTLNHMPRLDCPSVSAETDLLKVTVERLRLELQELNADRARLQREATAPKRSGSHCPQRTAL